MARDTCLESCHCTSAALPIPLERENRRLSLSLQPGKPTPTIPHLLCQFRKLRQLLSHRLDPRRTRLRHIRVVIQHAGYEAGVLCRQKKSQWIPILFHIGSPQLARQRGPLYIEHCFGFPLSLFGLTKAVVNRLHVAIDLVQRPTAACQFLLRLLHFELEMICQPLVAPERVANLVDSVTDMVKANRLLAGHRRRGRCMNRGSLGETQDQQCKGEKMPGTPEALQGSLSR